IMNVDIAPADPTKLAQPLFEIRNTKSSSRVVFREPDQDSDNTHAVGRLRVRPAWPGGKRAAKQRQNVSTSHGMASPKQDRCNEKLFELPQPLRDAGY